MAGSDSTARWALGVAGVALLVAGLVIVGGMQEEDAEDGDTYIVLDQPTVTIIGTADGCTADPEKLPVKPNQAICFYNKMSDKQDVTVIFEKEIDDLNVPWKKTRCAYPPDNTGSAKIEIFYEFWVDEARCTQESGEARPRIIIPPSGGPLD